jgi:DNA-binding NtrC family response regulator
MTIDSPGITDEAMKIMCNYSWPGNVRELANTVQKALIFSRGAPISAEEISQAIKGETAAREGNSGRGDETIRQWVRRALTLEGGEKMFGDVIDQFASLLITEALNLTGGNRSQAAKLLGLSRPTLLAKIEKYGIKIETAVRSD